MQPETREPDEDDLPRLTSNIVLAQVLDGGMVGGQPMTNKVLFSTEDPSTLRTLAAHLTLAPNPATGHCMCCGNPTIVFVRADGSAIAFGVHHGFSLRTACWKSDARLLNGRGLLEFLDSHGVPGPLAEHGASIQLAEAEERAYKQW